MKAKLLFKFGYLFVSFAGVVVGTRHGMASRLSSAANNIYNDKDLRISSTSTYTVQHQSTTHCAVWMIYGSELYEHSAAWDWFLLRHPSSLNCGGLTMTTLGKCRTLFENRVWRKRENKNSVWNFMVTLLSALFLRQFIVLIRSIRCEKIKLSIEVVDNLLNFLQFFSFTREQL